MPPGEHARTAAPGRTRLTGHLPRKGDQAMTETASQPVGDVTVPESPVGHRPAFRLSRWQSFGLAVGSLVLVYGLALVVMLAGGAVLRAVDPARRIDIFAALHHWWVVGVLLGITVLWLLPPHPWAKRVVASGSQEQPAQAGRTEGGGGGASTARSDVPGPGAVPRPGGG